MRWKHGNRLKLVCDSEAPPRTRQIFEELCCLLGLPAVPSLYRAYAAFPLFLEVHWRAFRPALESRQFFQLGARLAAESYTRAHNYFGISALASNPARQATSSVSFLQVLDFYQYLDPLLLLISAAQMQAFEGQVGQLLGRPEPASHPTFPAAPWLSGSPQATPAVQRIWEERRRILELAFISDEHRALACWPDFYQEYWSALKDLLHSPVYKDCQYRIAESAWTLVAELPVPLETGISQLLEAGLDNEQVCAIVRINQGFLDALTGLVMDIIFARIGCEGGTRGTPLAQQKGPASESSPQESGSPTQAA